MMKHEFEALAGYEVSTEDYTKVIEPMYMATDLSKADFVKVIDRKRFEVKADKTEEQIELEESIKSDIADWKNYISYMQRKIELYNQYINDEDGDYWKSEIKHFKSSIQNAKNNIAKLKWVLE